MKILIILLAFITLSGCASGRMAYMEKDNNPIYNSLQLREWAISGTMIGHNRGGLYGSLR